MSEGICPKCSRPLAPGGAGVCSVCMPTAESVSNRPPEPATVSVPARRQEDEWREPPPRKPILQPHRGRVILFLGLASVFLSLAAPCLTFLVCQTLDKVRGVYFSSDLRNQLFMAEVLLGLGAGILAWYWGYLDGRMMSARKMERNDHGITKTGKVMGAIAVLFLAALLLFCAGGVFFRWLAFVHHEF